jgi:hypothetical protein
MLIRLRPVSAIEFGATALCGQWGSFPQNWILPSRRNATEADRKHGSSLWVVQFFCLDFNMVRAEGLEPPRLAAPEPKSGASANFATPACRSTRLAGMSERPSV